MSKQFDQARTKRRRISPFLVFKLAAGSVHRGLWAASPLLAWFTISWPLGLIIQHFELGPKTAPTIYYFFPEYGGGKLIEDIFNFASASIAMGLWFLPWMIGLGLVAALVVGVVHAVPPLRSAWQVLFRAFEVTFEALVRFAEPKDPHQFPADSTHGQTSTMTTSMVPAEQIIDTVRLDASKRQRDFLNVCNVGNGSLIGLFLMLLVLISFSTIWMAGHAYLRGDLQAVDATWRGAGPGLLFIVGCIGVLGLAHLLHRRIVAAISLMFTFCAAAFLILYMLVNVIEVWSSQLSAASVIFEVHDWSVVSKPFSVHRNPTSGALTALGAALAAWGGCRLWEWGQWRTSIVEFTSWIVGFAIVAAASIWLALAAWPFLFPLDQAQDRFATWLSNGLIGVSPLVAPTLSLTFAFIVGAGILLLVSLFSFNVIRGLWLLTCSKRLTYASAKYPVPKKAWPHFLMTLGFSPSNYLSPHNWWTSTIVHFLARTAGGVSLWALVWFVVASRKALTIPMFEDIWAFEGSFTYDVGKSDPSAGPAFFTAIAALIFGAVLALIGNRFRPRLFDTLFARSTKNPILFLRPFTDNRGALTQWHWVPWRPIDAPKNIGEVLLDTAGCWGPVISIGRPEDEFEPHGPGSIYVVGADWRTVVQELADRAFAIVVLLDGSDGLRWEINHLRERGHFSKSIFLFRAGVSIPEAKRLSAIVGVSAPESFEGVPIALARGPSGWEWWSSRKHDGSSIHVALMRWFLLRFGYPQTVWQAPRMPPVKVMSHHPNLYRMASSAN